MPTPPRLSAQSASRNADAVEAADEWVDGGMAPDAALAKAARDFSVPAGHVPLLVRAFNTSRAVRQLGEKDVWAKAAAYPVADADKVLALLESPPAPAKQASITDYHLPPDFAIPAEPTVAWTKVAAAPAKAPPAPPKYQDLSTRNRFAAALAFDKAAAALRALPPAEYSGVKSVASRLYPKTAPFLFGELESGEGVFAKKASAAPSPAVGVDHAAVRLVGALESIRKAHVPESYAPPPPASEYRKVAEEAGSTLYQRIKAVRRGDFDRAVDLTKIAAPVPSYGLPVTPAGPGATPQAPQAAPAPAPAAFPGVPQITIPPSPVHLPGKPSELQLSAPQADPAKAAGFVGGLSATTKPLSWAKNVPITGDAMGAFHLMATGDSAAKATDALAQSAGGRLDANLGRMNEQAAMQQLLEDPRFSKADPAMVVNSYRQLRDIAPQAMQNPAIAADYMNRRLTMGPPSYYDLQALINIEKTLAQIKNYHARPDPDQDDA